MSLSERTTSDASSVRQGLGKKLMVSLADFRALMMQRIHEVNATTSREVLAAGASVGAITSRATSHARRVNELVGSICGHRKSGVAAAVARQRSILRRVFVSVSRDMARQEAAAERAQQHLPRITKAASVTARLAIAARLLAGHARAEAARVGGHDNCFSTIAGELHELAEEINRANELIDSVATHISKDLPEVAESARALKTSSEKLSQDLTVANVEVEREVNSMRNVIQQIIAESDQELTALVGSSHAALSHMQFQDVTAQALLRLELPMYELQLSHARELGDEELASEVLAPQHIEIGGDKPVDQSNAGDVVIF